MLIKKHGIGNHINKYSYLFNLAGYSAFLSIHYPSRYPESQIQYPAGYRILKKSGQPDIQCIPITGIYCKATFKAPIKI
jgi:hypothetical protein